MKNGTSPEKNRETIKKKKSFRFQKKKKKKSFFLNFLGNQIVPKVFRKKRTTTIFFFHSWKLRSREIFPSAGWKSWKREGSLILRENFLNRRNFLSEFEINQMNTWSRATLGAWCLEYVFHITVDILIVSKKSSTNKLVHVIGWDLFQTSLYSYDYRRRS